ncbi:hypothetical protein ES319_A05G277200v1 [Gossypium barbadense]|uniref:Protein kinase domain-containing protein n=2 Tax=Gossypium TaxID=3633 RepID=A0A5J5VVT5_GOSBA|nr:hypothetical protein ES319_A05G277200v1 [Gossypium barbadense]KAB2083565.1 hypothetical protein ES319_A05G277200v1 [Gossypium barbadense]TYH18618.1 hypothetical protein ES288_A05G287000v1 [Gossypium darwinii]
MGYFSSCNAESAIAVCDPYNCGFHHRKKPHKTKNNGEIREFAYADLVSATSGFSSGNFLGKGSHGSVYRAALDSGKLIAAVKKTKMNCNIPADNEIEILSRVYHPRLVNLIGYSSDTLCWHMRVRFALQVAEAVRALHSSNPPVIHRDIKSSNVLIDQNWNARLGDFGLALRGHVEDVRFKCTPPAGTLGYLDPAYLEPADVSSKSDVFSYGILLLEIISGRRAIDMNHSPSSVVDWAVPLIEAGVFAAICDVRVGSLTDKEVVRSLTALAARCVRSDAGERPGIVEVVECLTAVRKRVHARPVWSNRWRCMKGGDKSLVRNSRKVSSVTSVVDHDIEATSDRMARTKLITEASAASVVVDTGPDEIGLDDDHMALVRGNRGVETKTPLMKLRKSRSMGFLQSPRPMNQNSKNYVSGIVKRRNLSEFDMSKLGIGFDDEKSEGKTSEKALVLAQINV